MSYNSENVSIITFGTVAIILIAAVGAHSCNKIGADFAKACLAAGGQPNGRIGSFGHPIACEPVGQFPKIEQGEKR